MELGIVHLNWPFVAFALAALFIYLDCIFSVLRLVCVIKRKKIKIYFISLFL